MVKSIILAALMLASTASIASAGKHEFRLHFQGVQGITIRTGSYFVCKQLLHKVTKESVLSGWVNKTNWEEHGSFGSVLVKGKDTLFLTCKG